MRQMSFDHEIDKTLSALDAVKPSPGFESRVLRGLEERAMEAGHPRDAGGYSRAFRTAMAVGAGLAVVILALTVSAHRRAHRGDVAQVRSEPALSDGTSPVSADEDAALRNGEPGSAIASSATYSRGLRPRVLLHAARVARPSAAPIQVRLEIEGHAAAVPSARELDAQAAEDFRAASSPAPPLPPTAQERLVRLMLRRGEKHELAQLDPAEQAAFANQEQAAFHDFFDPPIDPGILNQTEREREPRSTSNIQPKTEGQPQ